MDRRRVQAEFGLVQDDRRGTVGSQQERRQADESQHAVARLTGQEGAIQSPLPPAQPDPLIRRRFQDEVVEERRGGADGGDDPLIVAGVILADA